jgi:hypothetical protein
MWTWVILLALVLGIVYLTARPGDCVIRYRHGEVTVTGRITRGRQMAVEEYLKRNFADAGRLRISLNYPKAGQRLRIRIRSSLPRGEEQMIRNFILSEF